MQCVTVLPMCWTSAELLDFGLGCEYSRSVLSFGSRFGSRAKRRLKLFSEPELGVAHPLSPSGGKVPGIPDGASCGPDVPVCAAEGAVLYRRFGKIGWRTWAWKGPERGLGEKRRKGLQVPPENEKGC